MVAQGPVEGNGRCAHSGPDMPRDPAIQRLMWFFAIVYTVEGIGQAKVGIVWQPLTNFLKVTQGWSPLEISAALAVLDIPWVIKPLYGILSDFLPLFGFRRRGYLVVANVGATVAFAILAFATAPVTIVPGLVVTAVAMAASSTICGALLVEAGQRHGASAAFVNQQWLWFNIAVMVGGAAGGLLAASFSPAGALQAACAIAALTPLAVLASLPLVGEARAGFSLSLLRRRLTGLAHALRSRTLWFVGLFLFCYYFSPGLGTPLYFHMTDQLGFSQAFIGVLGSANAAGWIAGGLLYRWLLARQDTEVLLRLSIVCGTGATLLYLGMVSAPTAVAIYFLAGAAGMIANIATLTLAAEHCPEGAEGFAFAALMSVINLAVPLADTIGSALYEHVFNRSLIPLILASATFTAAVFLLLPLAGVRTTRSPR